MLENFFSIAFIAILLISTLYTMYIFTVGESNRRKQKLQNDFEKYYLNQHHHKNSLQKTQKSDPIKTGILKSDINISITVEYSDSDGVITDRDIIIKDILGKKYDRGIFIQYITAWCLLRQELRNFRVDRILKIQDKAKNFTVSDNQAIYNYFLGLIEPKQHQFHYDYDPPLPITIYLDDGHIHDYKMDNMESFGKNTIRTQGNTKRITPNTRRYSGRKSFYNDKYDSGKILKIIYNGQNFENFFSLKEFLDTRSIAQTTKDNTSDNL